MRAHWTLVKELTFAEMKTRYRRTLAGFIWVVLNPIIMFGAQAIVFVHILKIDMSNYLIFLLSGLLPWTFMRSSLEMGIPVLQFSKDLLNAFKIPPAVLVFSSILDNWINFLAAFTLILFPVAIFSGNGNWGMFLLPLAIIPLLLGTAALTWLLSLLNVFYRDIRFVVGFVLNILFFLTPIFYPKHYIPEKYRWLIDLNALYSLIEPFQYSIYSFSPHAFMVSFVKALSIALGFSVLALIYWKKIKNEFYYYL